MFWPQPSWLRPTAPCFAQVKATSRKCPIPINRLPALVQYKQPLKQITADQGCGLESLHRLGSMLFSSEKKHAEAGSGEPTSETILVFCQRVLKHAPNLHTPQASCSEVGNSTSTPGVGVSQQVSRMQTQLHLNRHTLASLSWRQAVARGCWRG